MIILLAFLLPFTYGGCGGGAGGGGGNGGSDDDLIVLIEIMGDPEIVFDWTTDRCEDLDIPDLPARAFRDDNDEVQMISSHYITRRSVGSDLNNLTHECDIIMESDRNPDPEFFNDGEWLGSTYTEDGKTIYAIIHNEYDAWKYPGQCSMGDNYWLKCWYNGLTLAVSNNSGLSYHHPFIPPNHLIASWPERYEIDKGPYGIFHPSNIVKGKDGFYYVVVQLVNPLGGQWSCLIRNDDLSDPESWRFWDGADFEGSFVNPYTEEFDDPQEHVCQPIANLEISDMSSSLTYNEYIERYVLIGPSSDGVVWGFFYSLSKDLIKWTPRELLLEVDLPWTIENPSDISYLYPSLLDPNSASRNFETTGKTAYLYYQRHNRSGGDDLDRDLLRIPIEFFKE